jgi:glycosyltransferase involved in cell wall biosynthesis
MGFSVTHVCGGDVAGPSSLAGEYGTPKLYSHWYRSVQLLDFFVKSVSEYRDLKHDMRMARQLEKLAEKESYDLVWERSSRLHCAGLKIAEQANLPYVLEWKDNLVNYPLSLFRQYALKMEARKNQSADFIVVESDVLRKNLGKQGVSEGKILVAHNAVDSLQFMPNDSLRKEIRDSLNVADDDLLIGYMGSYAFYHDAARLVMAARLLNEQGAAKLKFLMVGNGKEYQTARRMAEEGGILNTMLAMHDAVKPDQVPAILSALDVAVLPGSTDIICPIKVQEYMSCGLPTLVPDYPCNREVLRDGVTGMFFEPKNEESLARKIRLLADDLPMRIRLGRDARDEAQNRFSWDKTWGKAMTDILSLSNIT